MIEYYLYFSFGSSTITEANLPGYTHTFSGSQSTDSVQFRNTLNGNVVELYGKKGIYSLSGDSGMTASFGITSESYSNSLDVLNWTYTPEGTISEGDNCNNRIFLPPFIVVSMWYRAA